MGDPSTFSLQLRNVWEVVLGLSPWENFPFRFLVSEKGTKFVETPRDNENRSDRNRYYRDVPKLSTVE